MAFWHYGDKEKAKRKEGKNIKIERVEPINAAIGPGSIGFGSNSMEIEKAIEENNRKNRI